MVTVDERRWAELRDKRKCKEALSRAERIEWRQLKAERSAIRAREEQSRAREMSLGCLDSIRMELGTIAVDAGLRDAPRDRIRHALETLARQLEAEDGGRAGSRDSDGKAAARRERTPEEEAGARARFSDNPFILEKDMTPEQKVWFARLRRAFAAAARGDYGPGIAMGIFSEGAGKDPILAAVAAIPEGAVLTYSQVAERAGLPRQAREVGDALARNPEAPGWHRVVDYRGRVRTRPERGQRAMLEAEGVVFDNLDRIDLHRFAPGGGA